MFSHWRGEYYANDALAGYPLVVRDDPTISFDWGEGAPAPLLPADRFSARWTRVITLNGGSYRFDATADDGVRVWVDQTLLIDAWDGPASRPQQQQTVLGGGTHALVVEYREIKGSARVNVSWQALNEPPR